MVITCLKLQCTANQIPYFTIYFAVHGSYPGTTPIDENSHIIDANVKDFKDDIVKQLQKEFKKMFK